LHTKGDRTEKLNILLAYSLLIFLVIAGFTLNHSSPINNKNEQEHTSTPVRLINILDKPENSYEQISQSALSPLNQLPKQSLSWPALQTIGPGVTSSNPELKIYENDPSTDQPTSLQVIDWSTGGPILPGQNRSTSPVYFRNEGSVPIQVAFSASNWAFKNSRGSPLSTDYQKYFTISWNYDDSTINAGQTIPVIFTLTVDSNINDFVAFSFDLIVTAY